MRRLEFDLQDELDETAASGHFAIDEMIGNLGIDRANEISQELINHLAFTIPVHGQVVSDITLTFTSFFFPGITSAMHVEVKLYLEPVCSV